MLKPILLKPVLLKPVRASISVAPCETMFHHNPVRGCTSDMLLFWQQIENESPTGI